MANTEEEKVPFIVYEAAVDRHERREKRSHNIILVLLITLMISIFGHFAWIYMWNQYEYVDTEVVLDSGEGGSAVYQNGEGNEVNANGESDR